MSGEKRNAVIILGMHRSGTSAIAGCLNQLGVKMGSTLMPGTVSNELGYFEHSDIVLVHDILLSDLGCRWDMVGNLPQGWLESEAAQRAKKKLLAIVVREFKGSRLWAVKDPRMCRLMPLWFEILAEIETLPKFILMVRHPFEVARSLLKRDGMDLLKGHLLWMTHNREALTACRGHEHVLLTYDRLLKDPVHCLESVALALNITWPRTLRLHYQKILGLVRPDLRHQHSGNEGGEQEKFSNFFQLFEQLREKVSVRDNCAKALSTDVSSNESSAVSAKNVVIDLDTCFFSLAMTEPETVVESCAGNPFSGIMRNLLSLIGKYERIELDRDLQRESRLLSAGHQGSYLYAQVFFPQTGGEVEYTEERSHKAFLVPGEWQKIVLDLPYREAIGQKRLRLDPLGSMGMVAISAVNLINSASGKTLWSATVDNGFADCILEGDVLLVSRAEALILVSTGPDPRILLPVMADLPDVPLGLEVWIKVERDLKGLVEAWRQREVTVTDQLRQLAEIDHRLKQSEAERGEIEQRLQAQQAQLRDKEEVLTTLKAEISAHIQKYAGKNS